MKTENPIWIHLLPWLSIPLVLLTYLFFWQRLPPKLVVHWSVTGQVDASALLTRGEAISIGLFGLTVILGLFTWQLRKATRERRRRVLFRYYAVTILLTACCLWTAFSNLGE